MRKFVCAVFVSALLIASCGEDDDTPPPPPQVASQPNVPNQPQQLVPPQQPGQVMVTVVANSTPPGATVNGGGRQLGITPLQTQVPIPAPTPNQVQTFAFTFNLAGYQPATINASPVNNTITITAALAPALQPQEVNVPPPPIDPAQIGADPNAGGDGDDATEITVHGSGGGAIFDNHTTTGFAEVTQDCTIDRLRVRLNGTHTFFADLAVSVRDPSGNTYSLQRRRQSNPFRAHTVSRAVGRQARGRWTVSIADQVAQDSGMLRGWSLGLRCR